MPTDTTDMPFQRSTTNFSTPMLAFIILASVMLNLNPNTFIILEFTPTDTTDMPFQRYTTPSLEFTLSASVKLILTLTLKWSTPLLSVDTHIPTLLLSVTFTTLVSMVLLTQPCPLTQME